MSIVYTKQSTIQRNKCLFQLISWKWVYMKVKKNIYLWIHTLNFRLLWTRNCMLFLQQKLSQKLYFHSTCLWSQDCTFSPSTYYSQNCAYRPKCTYSLNCSYGTTVTIAGSRKVTSSPSSARSRRSFTEPLQSKIYVFWDKQTCSKSQEYVWGTSFWSYELERLRYITPSADL